MTEAQCAWWLKGRVPALGERPVAGHCRTYARNLHSLCIYADRLGLARTSSINVDTYLLVEIYLRMVHPSSRKCSSRPKFALCRTACLLHRWHALGERSRPFPLRGRTSTSSKPIEGDGVENSSLQTSSVNPGRAEDESDNISWRLGVDLTINVYHLSTSGWLPVADLHAVEI